MKKQTPFEQRSCTSMTKTDKEGKRIPCGTQWRIRNAEFRDVDHLGNVWEVELFDCLYNNFPDMKTAWKTINALAKEKGYIAYDADCVGIAGCIYDNEPTMVWVRYGEWDHENQKFIPDEIDRDAKQNSGYSGIVSEKTVPMSEEANKKLH